MTNGKNGNWKTFAVLRIETDPGRGTQRVTSIAHCRCPDGGKALKAKLAAFPKGFTSFEAVEIAFTNPAELELR